jgi:DNA-binding protein H-NS
MSFLNNIKIRREVITMNYKELIIEYVTKMKAIGKEQEELMKRREELLDEFLASIEE